MVPDIVYLVIVLWVSGLVYLSLSFNSEESRPVEAGVCADGGLMLRICE